ATILPMQGSFYFTPEKEVERQKVNQWIRTSGKFDAVLDFDAVSLDPEKPTFLSTKVDCGDHLHLNDTGYELLAGSIDLKLFRSK
ncbi:MAG: SGNH/GDSL hydrolase family protein, partial [Acidobacteriota bacterium]